MRPFTKPYSELTALENWSFTKLRSALVRWWHWFLLSLILCTVSALLFLRYQTPHYHITASLLVLDDSRGSDVYESALLEELGLHNATSSVENEIEILKSRTLLTRVIDDLDLTLQYFATGHLKTAELYDRTPFKVTFLKRYTAGALTYRLVLKDSSFIITTADKTFKGKLGQGIELPHGLAVISTTHFKPAADDQYSFTVSPTETILERYRRVLTVQAPNKTASLVNLSIQEALPMKGEAILERLIALYQTASIAEKNKAADNTITFINANLKRVAAELEDVEAGMEAYRIKHKLIDLHEDSRSIAQTQRENESEEHKLSIRLKVIQLLQKHLGEEPSTAVPPSLYQSEAAFSALAANYNGMQQRYAKAIASLSSDHPTAKSLYREIETTKNNLIAAVGQQEREVTTIIGAIKAYKSAYEAQVALVPRHERQFLSQSRKQGIQQDLYLFLLKKRMETAISRSANTANARTIDAPKADAWPSYPNRQLTLLIALLSGFLIPGAGLYISQTFNDKISSKEDILTLCDIPIIGEISQQKKQILTTLRPNRSLVREQFRSLRTNIQFQAGEPGSRVVLITSAMANEGKSFVAAQLASSFALTGKKVLLIDFDLRKPSLATRLDLLPQGISDALSLNGDPLIQAYGGEHRFDFLAAGTVSNAADNLLLSPRVGHLLAVFRQRYDYILLDSPPAGLVVDARLLARHADMTLYILRQHFTRRYQLEDLAIQYKDLSLPKLSLVLNGTKNLHHYQYNYY